MANLFRSFLLAPLLVFGVMTCAQAADFQYRVRLPASVKSTTSSGENTVPAGSGTVTPVPGSDTDTDPSATGPIKVGPSTPAGELSATLIEFGNQAAHTSTTIQVLLTSTGTAPVHLTAGPTLTGSSAFGLGLTNCGTTLAVGQSCFVEVVYAPESVANDVGRLYFASDAINGPLAASLRGSAVNPVTLAAASQFYSFIGGASYIDFKELQGVSNEANPDKVMSSWQVVAGSIPPGFTFSNVGVLVGAARSNNIYTFTIRVTYRSNSSEQQYTMKTGTQCYVYSTCSQTPVPDPGPLPGPYLPVPETTPASGGGGKDTQDIVPVEPTSEPTTPVRGSTDVSNPNPDA